MREAKLDNERTSVDPQTIQDLIQRIESSDIVLPAFQRDFVWKDGQILSLIDSIYRGYPIGSVLLWNTKEELRGERCIAGFSLGGRAREYPVNYVLDGQQRLSAIFCVFCKPALWDANEKRSKKIKREDAEIFFDFKEKVFITQKDGESTTGKFPIRAIFNSSLLAQATSTLPKQHHEELDVLIAKFQRYKVPTVTTYERNKGEVGEMFERINNRGTKLNTLDLMVAWTWSEEFHLKSKIEDFMEEIEEDFGEIPEKSILQVLSAIIEEKTSTKVILTLPPEAVREKFNNAVNAIKGAIDFLETENLFSYDYLPHTQQLVVLSYFFNEVRAPSATQLKDLKTWFWRTSFSLRYRSGTDEKMNADIVFIKKIVKNEKVSFEDYPIEIEESDLKETLFSKSSPWTRAFLLVLGKNQPKSLLNGREVEVKRVFAKYNRKEFHHIFPKAYLKKLGVVNEKINSMCNFTLLTAAENKKINDAPPSDYLFNSMTDRELEEILDSNLMPKERAVYKKNQYEKFLEDRAKKIFSIIVDRFA